MPFNSYCVATYCNDFSSIFKALCRNASKRISRMPGNGTSFCQGMEKATVAVDAVAFKILMLVVPQKICHRPTSTDIDRAGCSGLSWFVVVLIHRLNIDSIKSVSSLIQSTYFLCTPVALCLFYEFSSMVSETRPKMRDKLWLHAICQNLQKMPNCLEALCLGSSRWWSAKISQVGMETEFLVGRRHGLGLGRGNHTKTWHLDSHFFSGAFGISMCLDMFERFFMFLWIS